MPSPLQKLTDQSPAETVRLVWRKFVYRKVVMRRVGAPAGAHVPLPAPTSYRLEVLGPDRYRDVLGTNPHLTAADLDDFDRQTSACVVALDGDRVAASTWMTSGSVHVHELHRQVEVPPDEHFCTRVYVDPDDRGAGLMSHLLLHYAGTLPAEDRVWALVYERNVASLRGFERVGWEWTGDMWTTFVGGRKLFGERALSPLPAAAPAKLRSGRS